MKIGASSHFFVNICGLAVLAFFLPALSKADDVQVGISVDQDVVQLDWLPSRGVLQSATDINGPWINLSAENPTWLFLNPSNAFFRILDVTNDILPLAEGVDLYHVTMGGMPLNIPPNFFDPGSQPFFGTVQLTGLPIGTDGAFELGNTDTIIRRSDRVLLPPPDSDTPVPIEIVALSLKSVAPITVNYMSSPSQQWDVFVQLGELPPSTPDGQMSIHRTFSGSTFDLQFPVVPVLVFSNNIAGVRTLPLVLQSLRGSNGMCSTMDACITDTLSVPRLPLGFCMQGIQLMGSQMILNLTAASATTHPPPEVDPSATIHPNVASLGRSCVISGGASIGEFCVIGPNAFIGSNVMVGSNVLIGGGAIIGNGTMIGDNSVVDDGTHIGSNSVIGASVVIGSLCDFGHGFQIGTGSRVGGPSVIGNNVFIGTNVVCEGNLTVGDNAAITNDLFLAHGANVGPVILLEDDLFHGRLPDGSNVVATVTNIEAQGGTVLGRLAETNLIVKKVLTKIKTVVPLVWNTNNPPAGLTNLQNDVNDAGGTTNRIKDRTYVKDTYDCDDFASDMEKALQALGYDATFTVYWHVVLNPAWRWWNDRYTKKYITEAHAITDVHTDDGIIWIEPQTGEIGIDIDFDGDGEVEYDTKHPGEFTDDDARIEVYDSREAAEKAGVVMD